MLDTLSLLGPTVRKIIAMLALAPVLFLACVFVGLTKAEAAVVVLGFWVGMVFPDLDVVTGWIRTTFQTMLLILFLGAVIMIYPIAWGNLGGFCPASQINEISTQLTPAIICKLGLAGLLMAGAYILAWLAVSWVPAKNSFHHWATAVMIAGGLGVLNQVLLISLNQWILPIGVGVGYGLHIILDGRKTPEGGTVLPPLPKNALPIMKYLRF